MDGCGEQYHGAVGRGGRFFQRFIYDAAGFRHDGKLGVQRLPGLHTAVNHFRFSGAHPLYAFCQAGERTVYVPPDQVSLKKSLYGFGCIAWSYHFVPLFRNWTPVSPVCMHKIKFLKFQNLLHWTCPQPAYRAKYPGRKSGRHCAHSN